MIPMEESAQDATAGASSLSVDKAPDIPEEHSMFDWGNFTEKNFDTMKSVLDSHAYGKTQDGQHAGEVVRGDIRIGAYLLEPFANRFGWGADGVKEPKEGEAYPNMVSFGVERPLRKDQLLFKEESFVLPFRHEDLMDMTYEMFQKKFETTFMNKVQVDFPAMLRADYTKTLEQEVADKKAVYRQFFPNCEIAEPKNKDMDTLMQMTHPLVVLPKGYEDATDKEQLELLQDAKGTPLTVVNRALEEQTGGRMTASVTQFYTNDGELMSPMTSSAKADNHIYYSLTADHHADEVVAKMSYDGIPVFEMHLGQNDLPMKLSQLDDYTFPPKPALFEAFEAIEHGKMALKEHDTLMQMDAHELPKKEKAFVAAYQEKYQKLMDDTEQSYTISLASELSTAEGIKKLFSGRSSTEKRFGESNFKKATHVVEKYAPNFSKETRERYTSQMLNQIASEMYRKEHAEACYR